MCSGLWVRIRWVRCCWMNGSGWFHISLNTTLWQGYIKSSSLTFFRPWRKPFGCCYSRLRHCRLCLCTVKLPDSWWLGFETYPCYSAYNYSGDIVSHTTNTYLCTNLKLRKPMLASFRLSTVHRTRLHEQAKHSQSHRFSSPLMFKWRRLWSASQTQKMPDVTKPL